VTIIHAEYTDTPEDRQVLSEVWSIKDLEGNTLERFGSEALAEQFVMYIEDGGSVVHEYLVLTEEDGDA
jgi:hypothetical protein